MKVLILMTDLNDLGVQRVVLNLYHNFPADIECCLALWRNEGKVAEFLVRRGPVVETDPGKRWPRFLFRLPEYVRIIRSFQPDVILSCVPATNLSAFLLRGLIPTPVPIIMCEHAHLTRAFATGEYTGPFRTLYRLSVSQMYNRVADRLVMTAEAGVRDAVENWGIKPERISLIYNPQDLADLERRAAEPLDEDWFRGGVPVITAAGRLTEQKGYPALLNAFAKLRTRLPVRLAILGRGPLEQDLRDLSRKLGIEAEVKFFGFQKNHLNFIRASSAFVLSSVWEGMPMVVAEAMAVGTPVVSFDCPSGPRELLDGGRCGFLVPDQDVDALAQSLFCAVSDRPKALSYARAARQRIEAFSAPQIAGKYVDLFRETIKARAH